jgi:hypothetical protein
MSFKQKRMEGRKEDQENFLEADENGRQEVRP